MVKRRCVFLDRDGVINAKAPEGEYVCDWMEFELIPSIVDWIRLFNSLKMLVVVVTNQRCVAKGMLTLEDLNSLHDRMREELADRNAIIDDVFACPHEIGMCRCRKPQPGMVLAARDKWDIDLARSIMIGDSESDRQLAENCGMTFVAAQQGRVEQIVLNQSPPEKLSVHNS